MTGGLRDLKRKDTLYGVLAILFLVSFCTMSRVSASSSSDDWPMFHHDLTRTGYSTSTAPTTSAILWNYTTGQVVWASPAISNGYVYIASDDLKRLLS